jgi:hypothetical protein
MEAEMNSHSATLVFAAGAPTRSTSRLVCARHFGEMVVAMFLGMGVLGGLAMLLFAAAGGSLTDQSVGLRVMLMGACMTIPMVAWMAFRGHRAARTVEMAASMVVPSVLVAVVALAGTLEAGAALGIQHGIMVRAMLGVMLWRFEAYAHTT